MPATCISCKGGYLPGLLKPAYTKNLSLFFLAWLELIVSAMAFMSILFQAQTKMLQNIKKSERVCAQLSNMSFTFSSRRPSPANAETIVGPMRNPNKLEPLCELSKVQKGTQSHLADFFRCQNCWTHQLQSKVHCSSTLTEKMHRGFLCLLA